MLIIMLSVFPAVVEKIVCHYFFKCLNQCVVKIISHKNAHLNTVIHAQSHKEGEKEYQSGTLLLCLPSKANSRHFSSQNISVKQNSSASRSDQTACIV